MIEYKSPIEIVHDGIEMAMEDEIYKAVQRVGVKVDKIELVKALAYDRDQYNKGYKQGYEDCQEEIVRCGGCKCRKKNGFCVKDI